MSGGEVWVFMLPILHSKAASPPPTGIFLSLRMVNVDDRLIDSLNESEMFLVLKIARRMKSNRMTAWPSLPTLAKDCGWDERTVKKWRLSLSEKGILKFQERSGKPTLYWFLTEGIGVFQGLKTDAPFEEESPLQEGTKNDPPAKNEGVQKMRGRGVQKMTPELVNKEVINNLREICARENGEETYRTQIEPGGDSRPEYAQPSAPLWWMPPLLEIETIPDHQNRLPQEIALLCYAKKPDSAKWLASVVGEYALSVVDLAQSSITKKPGISGEIEMFAAWYATRGSINARNRFDQNPVDFLRANWRSWCSGILARKKDKAEARAERAKATSFRGAHQPAPTFYEPNPHFFKE